MNMDRVVSVSAIACVVGAVMAQVAPPTMKCCKYDVELIPPEGGSACGAGTTMITRCETSSVGASVGDPLAMKEQNGFRIAKCQIIDIGDQGSWINIPCGSTPPPGAVFVGELENGSCCYATRPGGGEIVAEWNNDPIKVAICFDECDGDGGIK